ncbi:MAG: diaminopimelate decarboxylase, partial [Oscillospiraceae bacterium]|nr:diaminopimelate decarboxylase [Oscillospiraceae bacterium]
IYTALSVGFPPEDVCFHGCAKPWAEIEYAVKAGAGLFGVDSLEELARIDRCAGENGVRQRVLLRVTPGIDPHTFSAVDTGQVDCKFGEAIQTGQAMEMIRRALASKNIQVAGFHCHIGSQIGGPEPLMQAVDIMLDFMDSVRRELGYTAGVLDLGGGLGVPYTAEEPTVDYAAVIRSVGEHLNRRCQALDYPPPAVFMEPGRSIVAAAGVTLYTVQDVKSIPGCRDYVLVDGGMTDNPRYALYQARYTALIANRAGEPADCAVTLAGRCCESGDLIGEDMPMQRAAVGDIAAVLVTGAYNYSMASNYNRIPRPR